MVIGRLHAGILFTSASGNCLCCPAYVHVCTAILQQLWSMQHAASLLGLQDFLPICMLHDMPALSPQLKSLPDVTPLRMFCTFDMGAVKTVPEFS